MSLEVPRWARYIIYRTCRENRITEPSNVIWKKTRRRSKYSWAQYDSRPEIITVWSGWDYKDQRRVLIHELAHHLDRSGDLKHHNETFYRILFRLYRRWHMPMRDCVEAEAGYIKLSAKVYKKMRSKGGSMDNVGS